MRVGDVIAGRFELEKQAGIGGMGVVFQAIDRLSGHPMAIKAVLNAEHEFERFDREVAALMRIEHPRVVRYVAHGGQGDDRYLAMEWLEGEDLAERLAKGPLNLDETLRVVRGIAEALVALHAMDVIHRDIKPSNVFLVHGDVSQVKLLDLGIARTRDVAWTLTATGALLGTPAYMAPEQARGEAVDARVDLFALGCIFYECLVGQSPFAAAHPVASLARILVEDAPHLRERGISAPAGVETLVESLLAKDRDRRVGQARLVIEALDHLEQLKLLPTTVRSSLGLGEQQIVSVVLTRPASDTDADMNMTVQVSTAEHLQLLAELHGARLEQLANGAHLAVFASASSPRDRASNAAKFALELAVLRGADAIALATGRGEISGRLPVGVAIDRAVALLQPNQKGIVVDAVSAALLEGRFKLERDAEPYGLVGPVEGRDLRRTVAGKTSLFVGREREMSMMKATWRTCMTEPLASVVLVTAPAGTGKSRLIDEILQATALWEGIALTFVGGCDMMNAGARYGVLARAVRPDAIIEDGDRDARRHWLIERIRGSVAYEDAERTTELIAESCGLGAGHDASLALRTLRDNPLLLSDAIAEAWCTWIDAESRHGAVVFVLEDLHWGDHPTFNLIDRVLRVLADRPIFVLGTARPEVHEQFPRLWADRGVQEIRLGRIGTRSAERLVKRFLGGGVSDELVRLIVERSGGHPFVLEELVRAALADPSKFEAIPETVLGMLQARFYKLSERARVALRAASIWGGTFWLQGAEHLVGDTRLSNEFDLLVRSEFIERSRSSKFPGQIEYSFRHALIRDAAYAMLTEMDRQTGHLLAGAWLESVGEREALVLAQHFDRGGALETAGHWYRRAAEDALEGSDLGQAIRWASRAIECGQQGKQLARAELILADAKFGKTDMVAAAAHAASGRRQLPLGSDAWYSATSLLIGSLGQRGLNDDVLQELEVALAACTTPPTDAQIMCIARGIGQYVWVSRERMEPVYERLLELAEQTQLGPLARAWVGRVNAEMIPHRWYRPAEVARHFERASSEFERAGALRDAMMMRLFQAMLLSYTEHPGQGVEIAQKVLFDVEKRGLVYLGLFARLVQATAMFYGGMDQECLALLEPQLPSFRHSVRLYGGGLTLVALIALDAGDLIKAYGASLQVATLESMSDSGRFSACGLHACVLAAHGRVAEAIEWGERAFEYATPGFMDPFGELAYIGLAEAYLARGDRARARRVVEEHWATFLEMPLEHETFPRRRIFRRLASLAELFDLPKTRPRA